MAKTSKEKTTSLREWMDANRWSLIDMEKKTGISRTTIYNVANNRHEPSFSTAMMIEDFTRKMTPPGEPIVTVYQLPTAIICKKSKSDKKKQHEENVEQK